MKNYILYNEGSASPFLPEEKTLSYHIGKLLCNKNGFKIEESLQVKGILPFSRIKMKKFLRKHNTKKGDLYIFAKSYGVVEMQRYAKKNADSFDKFNKIFYFTIDGFSLIEYGAKKKDLHPPVIFEFAKIYNYFQRNDKIQGAFYKSADKNTKIDSTHMDITSNKKLLKSIGKLV